MSAPTPFRLSRLWKGFRLGRAPARVRHAATFERVLGTTLELQIVADTEHS